MPRQILGDLPKSLAYGLVEARRDQARRALVHGLHLPPRAFERVAQPRELELDLLHAASALVDAAQLGREIRG